MPFITKGQVPAALPLTKLPANAPGKAVGGPSAPWEEFQAPDFGLAQL